MPPPAYTTTPTKGPNDNPTGGMPSPMAPVAPADPAARTSTGFVSLGQYLDANRGAVNQTGNQLLSGANTAAQNAQTQAGKVVGEARDGAFKDPTYDYTTGAAYQAAQGSAADAQKQLGGLTTYGGVGDQLQKQFRDNEGQSQFDATLLGGSGQFQDAAKAAQTRFGDLQGYLDGQAQAGMRAGALDNARVHGGTMPNGHPYQGTGVNYAPKDAPGASTPKPAGQFGVAPPAPAGTFTGSQRADDNANRMNNDDGSVWKAFTFGRRYNG